MIKADQKKTPIRKLKQFKAESNSWITAVLVPQMLKVSKVIIKTSSKFKNNIKKSDSNSMLSDSSSEIIIKCICQNWASAKSDFAEWLRISDCKLHRLML